MNQVNRCPNRNHGRSDAPVKFCPNCGDSVNRQAAGSCDKTKHAYLRKQRHMFCTDCGRSLKVD